MQTSAWRSSVRQQLDPRGAIGQPFEDGKVVEELQRAHLGIDSEGLRQVAELARAVHGSRGGQPLAGEVLDARDEAHGRHRDAPRRHAQGGRRKVPRGGVHQSL